MRSAAMVLLTTAALALVAGCAADGPSTVAPQAKVATSTPVSTTSPTAADCPPTVTPKGGGSASVDYVDFVQANGRTYIAGLPRVRSLGSTHLGVRVLTVRCSYSELNDRTHQMTSQPRDGDAAFLTPGTPVYSIRGWSPNCRLAAREHGQLHVFFAYRPGGKVATPERCASAPRR
jgi:hypothetical protein